MRQRLLWIFFLLLALPVAGQNGIETTAEQTLTGTNPGDWFGKRVAAHGTTVVLGLPGTDIARGSVEIYEQNGDTWTLSQTILGKEINRRFGYAVAVHGDTLVVGEPGYRASLKHAGRVTVYTRNGDTWALAQTLDGAEPNDEFGYSVDLSETAMAIGAPKHGDDDRGRVYIYERDGNTWVQAFTHERPVEDTRLGDVVTIGDDVAFAAGRLRHPYHPVTGAQANYSIEMQVYVVDNGAWRWRGIAGSLVNGSIIEGFAMALDVEGDYLAVGIPYGAETGIVRLYTYAGDWLFAPFVDLEGEISGETFGQHVAIAGNRLWIGAPGMAQPTNEGNYSVTYGDTSGRVYTYTLRCGDIVPGTIYEGENNSDAFGFALALTDQLSVIGAPRPDGDLTTTGQVTVRPHNTYRSPNDVNLDGVISPVDVVFVVNNLGAEVNADTCPADVNSDGTINATDVDLVLATLGTTP